MAFQSKCCVVSSSYLPISNYLNIFRFGGVGGNGGSIYVVGKDDINLEHVFKGNRRRQYIAVGGKHATHNFILGLPGDDLKIDVPVGVTLVTAMGKFLGESLWICD